MALPRQVDVVDITAAAGNETRVFDPRHGLADSEFLHASLHGRNAMARNAITAVYTGDHPQ
jgi:hypothetical protein